MSDIHAELYMPVLLPLSLQEVSSEVVEGMVAELLNLHEIDLPFDGNRRLKASIREVSKTDEIPGHLLETLGTYSRDYVLLKVVAVAPGDPLPYYDIKGTLEGYDEWVPRALVSDNILSRISDLVVLANIASPGSLELGRQVLLIDGELYGSRNAIVTGLDLAVDRSRESGWPPLGQLPLCMVIDWASKPTWLLDESGGTPLIRALNAFTHVFGSEPDLGALSVLYALMGIEALYTSGGQGIARQIFERVQILLGKAPDLRRHINRMYEFRSQLVHGQMDFPGCFRGYTARDMNHYSESDEASNLANAIILATFQKMVVNNWKGLRFECVVEGELL